MSKINTKFESDGKIPIKRYSQIVYFDTNIIRDLSENRVPNAIQTTNLIKESIKYGKVAIAPSFEVLYELLSSPNISREEQIENSQFYDELVDWKYSLKPSDQILQEDTYCFANGMGPSCPFREIEEQSDLIQSIRNGKNIFSEENWINVVKKTQKQNIGFVETLFIKFIEKLSPHDKQMLKKFPKETWEDWWKPEGLAEIIAGSLTIKKPIRTSYVLLSLPTLRVAAGYILDTWYHQILNNSKITPTSHYDFRNAVIGASVGKIVTKDKKFTRAIHHIPKLDMAMTVLTLDEFVKVI